jgi:hypothetical protein
MGLLIVACCSVFTVSLVGSLLTAARVRFAAVFQRSPYHFPSSDGASPSRRHSGISIALINFSFRSSYPDGIHRSFSIRLTAFCNRRLLNGRGLGFSARTFRFSISTNTAKAIAK